MTEIKIGIMKEIIVGSTNPEKVNQIRGALGSSDIKIIGIRDKSLIPEVIENGFDARINARMKALAYAKALNRVVLSMDNSLFLNGLAKENQPGVNVRRIGKEKPLTDNEMIEYYSKLIDSLGGKVDGYWDFGICIANPEGKYKETSIISRRIFTSKASLTVIPGYPLESLQIDIETGKYISEMTTKERNSFWEKILGKGIKNLILSIDF